jgi:hypothetical protein
MNCCDCSSSAFFCSSAISSVTSCEYTSSILLDHVEPGRLVHAFAPAGPVGLGFTGIADEQQFRIELQRPHGKRALQAGQRFRCARRVRHPWCAPARRPADRRQPALGGDARRGAAGVVAVEAMTVVHEVLGALPTGRRPATASATAMWSRASPLFCGIELSTSKSKWSARSPATLRSQGTPLHACFRRTGLRWSGARGSAARSRRWCCALHRAVEPDRIEPVVAQLHAQRIGHRPAGEPAVPAAADRQAEHLRCSDCRNWSPSMPAGFRSIRVFQQIGEVGPQVEFRLDGDRR